MVHPTIAGLRRTFAAAARTPHNPDTALRRIPVPNRKEADYQGETMLRYIGGLELRLKDHMAKHMPRWHHRETLHILKKWDRPVLNHPAPIGAPRRDLVSQASDYAAALLHDRMSARLQRLDAARLSRSLDMPKSGLQQNIESFRKKNSSEM